MAQPASYYYRNISERADLFDMAMEISCRVAKAIVCSNEPGKSLSNADAKTQRIASDVLTIPQFAQLPYKESLMRQILDKTKTYWPRAPQLKTKLHSSDEMQWQFQNTFKTISMAVLPRLGFRIIPLAEVQIPQSVPLARPIEEISCFELALAKAGVLEASSLAWTPENLLECLTSRWSFKTVSSEQVQPGDLILFLENGAPKHMSIQCENGILSKPGNSRRFAYIHKLEEASRIYGNQVLFFRNVSLTSPSSLRENA